MARNQILRETVTFDAGRRREASNGAVSVGVHKCHHLSAHVVGMLLGGRIRAGHVQQRQTRIPARSGLPLD